MQSLNINKYPSLEQLQESNEKLRAFIEGKGYDPDKALKVFEERGLDSMVTMKKGEELDWKEVKEAFEESRIEPEKSKEEENGKSKKWNKGDFSDK